MIILFLFFSNIACSMHLVPNNFLVPNNIEVVGYLYICYLLTLLQGENNEGCTILDKHVQMRWHTQPLTEACTQRDNLASPTLNPCYSEPLLTATANNNCCPCNRAQSNERSELMPSILLSCVLPEGSDGLL